MLSQNPNETQVDFEIHYDVPVLILGQLLDRLIISRELERGFDRGFERMKCALEAELVAESRRAVSKYFWSAVHCNFDGPLSTGYAS